MSNEEVTNNIETIDIDSLINLVPLDQDTAKIAQQVIDETDLDETKKLLNMFNLNMAKKNVLRIMKLNTLLDKISDKAIERIDKRADEFTNKDLIDYLNVTQAAIDRANANLNLVNTSPAIVINNQTNNVNISDVDSFSSESKAKIADAIKSILDRYSEASEGEVIDVEDFGESDEQ